MNGKITVESEIGKGSSFRIYLDNISIANATEIKNLETDNLFSNNIIFDNAKILLVDDTKSNRDVVKHNLEQCNCVVYEVENGKEAIEFVENNKIDLILMDIQMPVMSGDKAIKYLKENGKFNSIPAVAFTALVMKLHKEKYASLFDDYLKKPITVNELIVCLMKFLPYTEQNQNEKIIKPKTINYISKLSTYIEKNGEFSKKFKNYLKDEILILFEEVYDIMDIDDCEKFANKLIKTGIDYKIIIFENMGTEILTAAKSYQFSELENLLTDFAIIIKKIKIYEK